MAYLTLNDYLLKIQTRDLDQILSSVDALRTSTERATITEIKSKLAQKYDVSKEFRDTKVFSITEAYKAGQLVYLNASAYSASATYAVDTMVLQAGNVYYCLTPITVGEAFTSSKWQLLGAQYQYFYVTMPQEPFNIYSNYSKTDKTFYNGRVYTCLIPSATPTHQGDLQAGNTFDIPLTNYFPDTVNYGVKQWGTGVAYTVTGVWPTDETKYTEGDNRNAVLVEIAIYLTIYKLSPRISPHNVPDIWVKNFDDSVRLLKDYAHGEYQLDIPLLQPRQGATIRMGSEVKRVNKY